MSEIHQLDLILKYLGRPLTEREQAAIITAIPDAFRAAYNNCAAQRYEAHEEAARCKRELESVSVAIFVDAWMDQEGELIAPKRIRRQWSPDMDRQLLDGVAAGKSRRQIAGDLGVSRNSAIAR